LHPLPPGSYHAVLSVTLSADVSDGYSITPAGTTWTPDRVIVVTERGKYPQCDDCLHDF